MSRSSQPQYQQLLLDLVAERRAGWEAEGIDVRVIVPRAEMFGVYLVSVRLEWEGWSAVLGVDQIGYAGFDVRHTHEIDVTALVDRAAARRGPLLHRPRFPKTRLGSHYQLVAMLERMVAKMRTKIAQKEN